MTKLDGSIVEDVRGTVAAGRRTRRRLPGGGLIHIDRPVPYLCVTPTETDEAARDRAAPRLIRPQASLLEPGSEDLGWLSALVDRILKALRSRRGFVLLCSVWERSLAAEEPEEPCGWPRPRFRIVLPAPVREELARPFVDALETAGGWSRPCRISVERGELPDSVPGEASVPRIGIAVHPVYRRGDDVFPEVARTFEGRFAVALREGLFRYCRAAGFENPHAFVLGRRTLSGATWNVDRRIADVDRSFDLLPLVTPCNTEQAWHRFADSGFAREPEWVYRPIPLDLEVTKRELFDIPIERVEDPVLAELLREKQEELDRQLTLLGARGTPAFLGGSLQLWGSPSPGELEEARRILQELPPETETAGPLLDADEVVDVAREEVASYEEQDPEFGARVRIDPHQPPGLLVTGHRLSVGASTRLARRRVEALLHHEIGTHLLTFHNGTRQRVRLFACGFAGYEPVQEGLAVLAEILSGGMTRERLRTLAGRVVATDALVRGRSFAETFQTLESRHGFEPAPAFQLVMRVYRGGGLTKDAIYLRGLENLISHLQAGGRLEPLLVGKLSLPQLPVLRELTHRNFYRSPPLAPRYLQNAAARRRLEEIRDGRDILELAS